MSVISVEQANALNKMVREKIDKALFLICNYAPTEAPAPHADAKFYLGIQDLYKFTVDTSCIIGNLCYYVPGDKKSMFSNFRKQIGDIKVLRTVIDHNIDSEYGGFFVREQLESYTNLLHTVLGKLQPEREDDFQLLYDNLETRAAHLLTDLESFINTVAISCDKEVIAENWKQAILDWYCKKQDIYMGQLADTYLANMATEGVVVESIRGYQLRQKLDGWIENALFADLDRKIESCDFIISEHPEYAARAVAEKEKHLQVREQRCIQIGNLSCRDYFFKNLNRQLQETMRTYSGGLLPQELLQADIKRVFSGVGAEDFAGT